jgi:type 1 fimbriae regulatory protein FimB
MPNLSLFLISMRRKLFITGLRLMVTDVGVQARTAILGHLPQHMLRHICGHTLADRHMDTQLFQDWLDHWHILHSAWYPRTSASQFDGVRE